MSTLLRSLDWARTAIGPMDQWPQSLRTTVDICLHSPFPMLVSWGTDNIIIYNESYSKLLGERHPGALGKPIKEIWPEIWETIKPRFDIVTQGETFFSENEPYELRTTDGVQQFYFTFSYTPVYTEAGNIGGVLCNIVDVTASVSSKNAEKDLRFRTALMEAQNEAIPDGILIVDTKGKILSMNKHFKEIWGMPQHIVDRLDDTAALEFAMTRLQDPAAFIERVNYIYAHTSEASKEEILFNDGRIIERHGNAVVGDDGTNYGWAWYFRDITEERRSEEQLRRFKFMADNANDPFILIMENGHFAYLNDLALERWGYTREEALHLRVPDIDPMFNDDRFSKAFSWAQKENIPPFETLHKKKDGTAYPVEINMGGLILEGRPYLFAVARDISERKKFEEALRESENNFRSIVMQAPVGMAIYRGTKYIVEVVNDYYLDLTAKKREDFEGYPLLVAFPEIKEQGFDAVLDIVRTTGKPYHATEYEGSVVRDGKLVTVFVNFVFQPLLDQLGKVERIMVIILDVSDQVLARRKIEEIVSERTLSLKEANMLLQKSNAELEQYAYVASHDLQEPLRKIKTFAGMVQDLIPESNEKEKSFLQKIIASSERMSVLINDILNFSKLGKAEDVFVPTNLNDILKNVVADLELDIERGKVSVKADELPVIDAISIQMNQLFFNLLANSIKFARENIPLKVKITTKNLAPSKKASYPALDQELDYVELVFTDNGIGFDQQYADTIFNIFQRLNNRTYPGSGIGLSLCRRVVMHHGGEIFAVSEQGHGASFHILLPYKRNV